MSVLIFRQNSIRQSQRHRQPLKLPLKPRRKRAQKPPPKQQPMSNLLQQPMPPKKQRPNPLLNRLTKRLLPKRLRQHRNRLLKPPQKRHRNRLPKQAANRPVKSNQSHFTPDKSAGVFAFCV